LQEEWSNNDCNAKISYKILFIIIIQYKSIKKRQKKDILPFFVRTFSAYIRPMFIQTLYEKKSFHLKFNTHVTEILFCN